MTQAYPRELRWLAKDLAAELCVEIREGVYAGLLGRTSKRPPRFVICGPSAQTWPA